MSEPDDLWEKGMEATHKAMRGYASVEFEALARKVVYRLQRFPASGIYGDDHGHKSLWDEYRYEVAHGPTEPLEAAWDATLDPFLKDVVDRIPPHSARLLSAYAIWELDQDRNRDLIGSIWSEGIEDVLRKALDREAAGARDWGTW